MNYVVKKISEIDNNQLHIFYKDVFKDRCEVLLKNLKWYYRINYLNCEPIVLVLKNKVVGQLGLIPIKVKIRNNIIPATWYIDLVVHPEFQGKGLGSILVNEGQKQSKIQIAICNEAALKVYKKKQNDELDVIKEPIELLKKGSQEEAQERAQKDLRRDPG